MYHFPEQKSSNRSTPYTENRGNSDLNEQQLSNFSQLSVQEKMQIMSNDIEMQETEDPPKLVSPISINSVYSADSTSPSLEYSTFPLPSLPQRPGERTRAKSSDFSLEFLLSSPFDNPTTIEAMKNAQQRPSLPGINSLFMQKQRTVSANMPYSMYSQPLPQNILPINFLRDPGSGTRIPPIHAGTDHMSQSQQPTSYHPARTGHSHARRHSSSDFLFSPNKKSPHRGRPLGHARSISDISASYLSSSKPSDIEGETLSIKSSPFDTEDDPRGIYHCTVESCGKYFTRRYNLLSHMRVHSGERPFPCYFCSAEFSRKHDLRRHVRSLHSDDRPHHCLHCNLTFARSDALKRHIATEIRRGDNSHGKAGDEVEDNLSHKRSHSTSM